MVSCAEVGESEFGVSELGVFEVGRARFGISCLCGKLGFVGNVVNWNRPHAKPEKKPGWGQDSSNSSSRRKFWACESQQPAARRTMRTHTASHARTHERTKSDFPVGLTPPTSDIR